MTSNRLEYLHTLLVSQIRAQKQKEIKCVRALSLSLISCHAAMVPFTSESVHKLSGRKNNSKII